MENTYARLITGALASQGHCVIRTSGQSMRPTIEEGEFVELQQYPYKDLYPGLIVAFVDHEGHLTAHRIKYRVAAGFLTVGDSNLLLDGLLEQEAYIGLCVAKISSDGTRVNLVAPHITSPYTNRTAINLYIDDHLIEVKPSVLRASGVISTRRLSNKQFSPGASIGITRFGTEDDAFLIQAISSMPSLDLIYGAPFGPTSTPFFPVSQLRATVRLRLFDHAGEATSPLEILAYLEGLIVGLHGIGAPERALA